MADIATLTKALKKTFENCGHAFTMEQFEPFIAMVENKEFEEKWSALESKWK